MFLQSLATAFPPNSLTQAECLALLKESAAFGRLKASSQGLLQKILGGDSGILRRQFCVDDPTGVVGLGAGELHRIFETHAPALASRVLSEACERAGVLPREIDALLVCTCTGYLCPGLTSHVAERLGIGSGAFLQDLLGLGCGAALPMLEAARGVLAARPGALVATVAVEVCSAAFFLNDEPGVLVSLCLFGDGAAAALWRGRDLGGQFRFGGFRTIHLPQHREKIRFVNDGGFLKNQLHREVPILAARAVSELYGSRTGEPDLVATHTGGRDVLDAIGREIPGIDLDASQAVLRDHGNISSPSVLAAVEAGMKPETRRVWMAAFGAGFSAHCGELVRTDGA
jgi:alkylresorcinol/alkylpyrone synthase